MAFVYFSFFFYIYFLFFIRPTCDGIVSYRMECVFRAIGPAALLTTVNANRSDFTQIFTAVCILRSQSAFIGESSRDIDLTTASI